jgi:hypothetical protein
MASLTNLSPETYSALRRTVRTQEFQISFMEPFRVVLAGALLALEAVSIATEGFSDLWLLLGVLPAVTAVLSAISIGLIVWQYRFTVGPEGIQCYDFWCRPVTTRWEEMQWVRRIWLPGMAYARIGGGPRQRSLWLPLFGTRAEELEQLVALQAGDRHPLTQLLASQRR